jgi:3-hydroxymyristoyl/3-hydroxydecanoyl-(acyl carrier protein) dehydratase
MRNLSVRLAGQTRESIRAAWKAPAGTGKKPAIFDTDRITAFAVGRPSEAFGEPYRVFDEERVIARLPGPPFQYLDRITRIDAEPWVMKSGGRIEAQYDVPPDAWYFASNRQPHMPFAVLLEAALQPCGWLAAYVGSALTSPIDLSFRNLGGTATQHRRVGPDSGTLTNRVERTSVSSSAGMIIQRCGFSMSDARGPVYEGTTEFGFFSKEALSNQVGLRDAVLHEPGAAERERGRRFDYPREAPYPDDTFRMIDRVDLHVPDGGPAGLGFIRGSVDVDPSAWFFKAHFFQDPVWPGSLGLESMLQLMKAVAADRWGGTVFENVALGRVHTWTYRGQVIPSDRAVTVDVAVTKVDPGAKCLTADGTLTVDGRIIYRMKDFTVRVS